MLQCLTGLNFIPISLYRKWSYWHKHQRCRSPWMIPYYVNNCPNYAFINPVQCHLGSMAVWSLRIVSATSAYAYAKCLHRFGQFNAFLDMFHCIKSSYFSFLVTESMINSLLGSASTWRNSSCAQSHIRTQPAGSPQFNTSGTMTSHIIPPLHLIRPKKKSCSVVLHRPPLIFENWKKLFTVQKYTAPNFQNSKKVVFFLSEFWSFKNIFKIIVINFFTI